MPIRIKAIEKKMNVGIHKDTYRYQMQLELYSTLADTCRRNPATSSNPPIGRSYCA
jgi:hypothetical protein